MPKINLSEIEISNVVPAGTYRARLTEVKDGTSNAGNPKQTFTFKISDGEYAGRVASTHRSLEAKSLWSYKATLLALGMTEDIVNDPDYDTDQARELVGTEANILISNGVYQDRPTYGIDRVLPLEPGW